MRSSYPCQLSLDAHAVLGLASSAAVLTAALTLGPSPTDRDAVDLKTRAKFTATENCARTYCSQLKQNCFVSSLSFSKIVQLLVQFFLQNQIWRIPSKSTVAQSQARE